MGPAGKRRKQAGRHAADSPDAQQAVKGILASLVRSLVRHSFGGTTSDSALAKPDTYRGLVALLRANSTSVQIDAALAVQGLSSTLSTGAAAAIGRAGGVEAVVAQLGARDAGVREAAARALDCLIDYGSAGNAAAAIRAGAAPALVELLASGRRELEDAAADALAIAAAQAVAALARRGEAAQSAIVEAGAIPALVALVRWDSGQAQLEAVIALYVLAGRLPMLAPIARAGAIPPLVALMGSDSSAARLATSVLVDLADNLHKISAAQQAAIVQATGVQWLVTLLSCKHAKLERDRAVGAILRLITSSDAGRKQIFIEAGAVPALTVLRDRAWPGDSKAVADCLADLQR